MVPSGNFRVWVETETQLHAVLSMLEDARIEWFHGEEATHFIPSVSLPFGLVIKDWVGFGREIKYNANQQNFFSRISSDFPIYKAEEFIELYAMVSCDSVFGLMNF